MRLVCAVAGAAFACSVAGLAETRVSCDQTLTAPLRSNALLFIESRPAGLRIVGTDHQAIHVTCSSGDGFDLGRNFLLEFTPDKDGGRLTIEGRHVIHHEGLQVTIEVPWKTNLSVRMPAGQVKVEEIKGDKDIVLYAGQITISSKHEWKYRSLNASVAIGDVRASMYDADKGGFFRGITRTAADGEYRLHAHITTGQIELVGRKPRAEGSRAPD